MVTNSSGLNIPASYWKNSCSMFLKGPDIHAKQGVKRATVAMTAVQPQSVYLHMFAGNSGCESMGLFIKADPVPKTGDDIGMAITGSVGNKQFMSIPLHTTGSAFRRTMNLVVTGKDSGGETKQFNLFVTGGNKEANGNTPLFICNNSDTIQDDTTSMFIRGEGQSAGFIPHGKSVNLYVERGPTVGITMYMCNNYSFESIGLRIVGAPQTTNALPMNIRGLGDTLNISSTIFIRGDVFSGVSGSATLVIPKAIGFVPESAHLYTNGFKF